MTPALQLSDADVARIAEAVVSRMQTKPAAPSQWLTHREAAELLNISPRSFDRLRGQYERVFVGGLSMGGLLALHVAARRRATGRSTPPAASRWPKPT